MDDMKGINNYWPQFQQMGIKTDNDPKEWKSQLTDPQTMLKHLKPLPCQKDNKQSCVNKEFADRHVEKLFELLKNKNFERNRKISKTSMEHETKNEKLNFGRINEKSNFEMKSHRSFEAKSNSKIEFRKFEPKPPLRNCNAEYKKINSWSSVPKYGNQRNYKESSSDDEVVKNNPLNSFKTARTEHNEQLAKKNLQAPRKTLGGNPSVSSRFVCPVKAEREKVSYGDEGNSMECDNELFKNIDPKMIEQIKNEIMDSGTKVMWNDIAGLEYAKRIIQEVVVIPMMRPELFTGLRQPPKGILLFGPPGTGKTLIGKCIASQSKSTFFSISASSLTSKWIGEGEKLVKCQK